MTTTADTAMKKVIFTKMAYERANAYIGAARTIMHINEGENFAKNLTYKNLWHILDLMEQEIHALDKNLDTDADNILFNSTPTEAEHAADHSA